MNKLKPKTPNYYFMPFDDSLNKQYNEFYSVKDIFKINGTGIITARDKLTIDFEEKELLKRVKDFISIDSEKARERYDLGKDTSNWAVQIAQNSIGNKIDKNNVKDISYRPFDNRKIYYIAKSNGILARPAYHIMKHMLAGDNIGLLISRSGTGLTEWREVQITDNIVELGIMSTRPGNGTPIFPLYLYPQAGENVGLVFARSNKSLSINHFFITRYMSELKLAEATTGSCLAPLYLYPEEDLLSKKGFNMNRIENFKPEFRKYVNDLYQHHYSPEEIMGYIYGVLHSEFYHTKYLQYLKMDFPRVPFTKNKKLFEKLSKLGSELIDTHLMKNIPSAKIGDYIGKGSDEVLKPKYDVKTKRVYINQDQYFDKVDKEIWEFYIGGYQVIDKYLKSRKGRKLSSDEINNVGNIVKVLNFTIKQMKNIDEVYSEVDKEFY